MVAWAEAQASSAASRALQVIWLTSVLPATTAAPPPAPPGSGERKVPAGTMISSGFRQPSFSGMSSPTRARKQYSTTARQTAGGRVEIVRPLRPGAGEVDHGAAVRAVHPDRDLQRRAVIDAWSRSSPSCRRSPARGARFLGIVHHVAHIGAHGIQPVLAHRALQFLHALLVGGDLRLDVGDVHVRAAGRVPGRGQQRAELGLAEPALLHQQEVVDDDALLLQRLGTAAGSSRGSARRYRRGGRGCRRRTGSPAPLRRRPG